MFNGFRALSVVCVVHLLGCLADDEAECSAITSEIKGHLESSDCEILILSYKLFNATKKCWTCFSTSQNAFSEENTFDISNVYPSSMKSMKV